MTALNIQKLCKSFGSVEVLRDFSLDIQDGEFISLLGPSGCGKTTTLRCVAGFEFPNQGRIEFDQKDMTFLAPEKRDVGMVFQSYALFPHMSVRENLAFGLEMRGMAVEEIRRRVDDILQMVQLTGMDDRFPRELSGGQQQRVALARALVIEPSVLLLDEPLANLDATLRDDMRFFIRDLQQRVGITSIYV
ncbi:MAG: ABC transporter ATP-binding protein, partial [Planctomycetales bacterium]